MDIFIIIAVLFNLNYNIVYENEIGFIRLYTLIEFSILLLDDDYNKIRLLINTHLA